MPPIPFVAGERNVGSGSEECSAHIHELVDKLPVSLSDSPNPLFNCQNTSEWVENNVCPCIYFQYIKLEQKTF